MTELDNKPVKEQYRELCTFIYRLHRCKTELRTQLDAIDQELIAKSQELARLDALIDATSSFEF